MRCLLQAAAMRARWSPVLLLAGVLFADVSFATPNPLLSDAQRRDDPRIVQPSPTVDADGNYISDFLEEKLAEGTYATVALEGEPGLTAREPPADLLVAFDHVPTMGDVRTIEALDGQVLEAWDELVYAMRVVLPPSSVGRLASLPGVMLVEENAATSASLYLSTRQTRARTVWAAPYSKQGDGNHNIAVLDSGIDATHPDFSATGKIAGWVDEIGQNYSSPHPGFYTSPVDIAGHGSAVAAIIAGPGTQAGLGSTLDITQPMPLANVSPFLQAYFPLGVGAAGGTVQLGLKWADTDHLGGGAVKISLFDATGTSALSFASHANQGTQPLTLSGPYSVSPGTQSYVWRAEPSKNFHRTTDPSPCWVQSTSPMQPIGDGYNLVQGLAPSADLVGVKVLDDLGRGLDSATLNGLTWVSTNKAAYHVVVANLSLDSSGGTIRSTVDTAVNNLTRVSGIVVVCAAGNQRQAASGPRIYSPASASAAITTAATNENDAITDYSSYGDTGVSKPDVAAPGGSDSTHRRIITVDANGGDPLHEGVTDPAWHHTPEDPYPEAFSNDYTAVRGTSFAAAHVAGAAALVAQSLGTWNYTSAQARKVKALLEMTATETNTPAEYAPDPALDRGNRDTSEGYGRLNVDAAVEAASMSCPVGSPQTGNLRAGVTYKQCWARYLDATVNTIYTVTLANPPGGDYDLYVYQDTSSDDGSVSLGSVGDPVLQGKSTRAGTGGAEQVVFQPLVAGRYYVVVKRVSGGGNFTLTCTVSVLGVSVTPGTWALGAVAKGATKATWTSNTPALGGAYTATNTGTGSEVLGISSSWSSPGFWAPTQWQAADRFVISWGQTATKGTPPSYFWFDTNSIYLALDQNNPAPLSPGASFAFDLKFDAPTSSSSTSQNVITVTVGAYPPP